VNTSTQRRLARGVATVLLGRVVGLALNAVTLWWMARWLGPEQLGVYVQVFVYVSFYSALVDNGLNIAITRRLSEGLEDAPEVLGTALLLKGCATALLAVVAIVVARVSFARGEIAGLVPMASGLILVAAFSAVNAYYQARAALGWVVAGEIVGRALFLPAAAAVFAIQGSLGQLFLAQVIVTALGATIPLMRAIALVSPRWRIDPTIARSLTATALTLSATLGLGVVTSRFDVFVLPYHASPVAVGQYAAAFRLIDLMLLVPGLMMQVVFPAFVAGASSTASLEARFRRVAGVLTMIGLPSAVILTVAAEPILVLAGGPAYAGGASSLAILAWGMLAVYMSNGMMFVLVARGLTGSLLRWCVIGAVASIALNLLLVPRFGVHGAATATIAAHVSVLFGLGWSLWRELGVRPWPTGMGDVAVVTSIVLAAALWLLPRVPFPVAALLLLAAATGAMLALPGTRRELHAIVRRESP
jgi:O-antigen/teichoic acid export membrane protein